MAGAEADGGKNALLGVGAKEVSRRGSRGPLIGVRHSAPSDRDA